MTTLPRDTDDNTIQALRLNPLGAHSLTASPSVSARNGTAFAEGTRIVSVYATGPIYMQFGESGVIADSGAHFFPAGLYYDFAIGGGKTLQSTHLAVLAADTSCQVYISEKN